MEAVADEAVNVDLAGHLLPSAFAEAVGKPFGTVYDWIRFGKVRSVTVKRGEKQDRYYVPPEEVERVKRLIEAGSSPVGENLVEE